MYKRVAYIEVTEHQHGQRLDNFLIRHLKGVPKSHVYRLIRKGEVRVNKKRAKQITRLEVNDVVRIPPIRLKQTLDTVKNVAKYEFLQDLVLFEDEAILVINKPSGMAVHSGSGIQTGIIEALRLLRTDLNYLELAHRLDRETSGCLVMAKKLPVLRQLNQSFNSSDQLGRTTLKQYTCLLQGEWRFGERMINKPLDTQARRQGERHVIVSDNGQTAQSKFVPVKVTPKASLMKVSLFSGRTHQIRVHAMSENHPVAGDTRYGNTAFNKAMRQEGLTRLFLHACTLSLAHPVNGKRVTWNAPLPDELDSVLMKVL